MNDDLGDRADALRGEVKGLREDVQGFRVRLGATDRRLWQLAAGVVLVLALIAGTGLTAYRGLATDRRIDSLCPVLALVIGGYDPSTRPEGAPRDQYVANAQVMQNTYRSLGCTDPLVPPRSTP